LLCFDSLATFYSLTSASIALKREHKELALLEKRLPFLSIQMHHIVCTAAEKEMKRRFLRFGAKTTDRYNGTQNHKTLNFSWHHTFHS